MMLYVVWCGVVLSVGVLTPGRMVIARTMLLGTDVFYVLGTNVPSKLRMY